MGLCTQRREFRGGCKNRITLKALANFSPGFALKPWVENALREIVRNPEGVARSINAAQLLQSCAFEKSDPFPRVAKAQPWAGIGERFQRYSIR